MIVLPLTLGDAGELRALYDAHLSKGRVFLPGVTDVEFRSPCLLVLDVYGSSHSLEAEVVFVAPQESGGVGLELAPLDERGVAALRAFVELAEALDPAAVEDDDANERQPTPRDDGGDGAKPEGRALEGGAPPSDEDDAPDEATEEGRVASSIYERMRGLSAAEQHRLAAGGTLGERVALERMYGPNVWDTLLRNARITVPEVARIARKGTLPRPLVEAISANAAWLASPEVQRALLSNPRSSVAVVAKILRAMPRNDLTKVPVQTAYPVAVRQAAKRLLGGA